MGGFHQACIFLFVKVLFKCYNCLVFQDMKENKELVTTAESTTETRSQMLVNYLKDLSSMLHIIFAGRAGNINLHLTAERHTLKLIFAFDHIKYNRYNSFQQAFQLFCNFTS